MDKCSCFTDTFASSDLCIDHDDPAAADSKYHEYYYEISEVRLNLLSLQVEKHLQFDCILCKDW